MLPYWKIARGGWENTTRVFWCVVGRWERNRAEWLVRYQERLSWSQESGEEHSDMEVLCCFLNPW